MATLLDRIKKDSVVDLVGDKDKLLPWPTGFKIVDWHNVRSFTHPEEEGRSMLIGGIPLGKMTHISGYTGTGKSTLAIQIAVNVCKEFGENSFVLHFDQEDAFTTERVAEITGLDVEEAKKHYIRSRPTVIDEAFAQIANIYKMKRGEDTEEYMAKNQFGYDMLVPTFVIIDTVIGLRPGEMDEKEAEEEEMTNATFSSFAQAKRLNNFFQRLPRYMSGANISVIAVNHVRPFVTDKPTPKQVFHMKASETIPGGTGQTQLADFQITMRSTEKLTLDKAYKTQGHVNQVTIVKSRNDIAGRMYNLVFLPDAGFDGFLSSMYYLQSEKHLQGSPRAYFVETKDGTKSPKFTLGNARQKYNENEDFRKVFDAKVEECLHQQRFG